VQIYFKIKALPPPFNEHFFIGLPVLFDIAGQTADRFSQLIRFYVRDFRKAMGVMP